MALDLLGSVFGALLSGVIVNGWVFGLICVLTYQYFRNFPNDGKGTKILAIWMFVLQAFNAFLVSEMIYFYLITSFGDKAALGIPTWEFALFHGLSAVAAFFVQVYNARRIYVMTKQYTAVAAIVLFATVSVAFALALTAELLILGTIGQLHNAATWVAMVWLTCTVVSDLLITLFQVVYLHRHRTGIDKTNRIINILILYIMSTGLLTSVCVVIELLTFATLGWNYVHVFISVPLGGIYTISFLANLDARRRVRELSIGGIHTFKMASGSNQGQGINIEVKHTRQVTTDKHSVSDNGLHTELITLGNKSSTFGSKFQVDGSEHGTDLS